MMRPPLPILFASAAGFVSAVVLAACGEPDPDAGWTLAIESSADQVDFGLVTYQDALPAVDVDLVNVSGVKVTLESLEVQGNGSDFVVLSGLRQPVPSWRTGADSPCTSR